MCHIEMNFIFSQMVFSSKQGLHPGYYARSSSNNLSCVSNFLIIRNRLAQLSMLFVLFQLLIGVVLSAQLSISLPFTSSTYLKNIQSSRNLPFSGPRSHLRPLSTLEIDPSPNLKVDDDLDLDLSERKIYDDNSEVLREQNSNKDLEENVFMKTNLEEDPHLSEDIPKNEEDLDNRGEERTDDNSTDLEITESKMEDEYTSEGRYYEALEQKIIHYEREIEQEGDVEDTSQYQDTEEQEREDENRMIISSEDQKYMRLQFESEQNKANERYNSIQPSPYFPDDFHAVYINSSPSVDSLSSVLFISFVTLSVGFATTWLIRTKSFRNILHRF